MKHVTVTLPGMKGNTVRLPIIAEVSTPAELVEAIKRAQLVSTCPQCSRRLTWIGKVNNLCAHCMQKRDPALSKLY